MRHAMVRARCEQHPAVTSSLAAPFRITSTPEDDPLTMFEHPIIIPAMPTGDRERSRIARGSIPLHFQIERVIRARIQSGDYPPGAALPSEAQLCQEFQVSRSTLRQALGSLQRERLITRHSGKGTFVAAPVSGDSFAGLLGSIDDIFAYARETQYRLLAFAHVEPSDEVTAMLKVPPGSKVIEYHGLRCRNGPPFVYVTTWLPMNIGQQLDPADIQSG